MITSGRGKSMAASIRLRSVIPASSPGCSSENTSKSCKLVTAMDGFALSMEEFVSPFLGALAPSDCFCVEDGQAEDGTLGVPLSLVGVDCAGGHEFVFVFASFPEAVSSGDLAAGLSESVPGLPG